MSAGQIAECTLPALLVAAYLINGDPRAQPLLSAAMISSPDQDLERLREASVRELSEAQPGSEIAPAELVDPAAPPAQRLLDLSLADDRFSPLLIETSLSSLVQAWEADGDGSSGALAHSRARAGITSLLQSASGDVHRYVKDAALEGWTLELSDDGDRTPRWRLTQSYNR